MVGWTGEVAGLVMRGKLVVADMEGIGRPGPSGNDPGSLVSQVGIGER